MKNLILSLSILVFSGQIFADIGIEYKYKIKTGLMIQDTCQFENQKRKSEFKIFLKDDRSNEISFLPIRLSICPRSGDLIRRVFNLPIPTLLLTNIDQVVALKKLTLPLVNSTFADEVTVELTRQSSAIVEFSVKFQKETKSLTSFGQILLIFSKPELLSKVEGYNYQTSVPLKSLSVELKDKGITLVSELYRISNTD